MSINNNYMRLADIQSALNSYTSTSNTVPATTAGFVNYPTTTGGNSSTPAIGYMQQLETNLHHQYPQPNYIWNTSPNEFEQAFKVLAKLTEISLIRLNTVDDFIKAVNEIAKVL